jgi:hypothetical protein
MKFAKQLDSEKSVLLDLQERAKKVYGGYSTLKRRMRKRTALPQMTEPELYAHVDALGAQLTAAEEQFEVTSKVFLPKIFRLLPLPLIFVLAAAGGGVLGWYFASINFAPAQTSYIIGGAAGLVTFLLAWSIQFAGYGQIKSRAQYVTDTIAQARNLIAHAESVKPGLLAKVEQDRKVIQEEHEKGYAEVMQEWGRAGDVEATGFCRRRWNGWKRNGPR